MGMGTWTPRHLRKTGRKSDDQAKKLAFRKAARWSKRFIKMSASQLEKPKVASHYAAWCDRSRAGKGLR